ncbi:DUF3768 domain-containing protein [Sphingomonas crocodyli]|uniref:DUF3768 domain-containing protein n=2 Tax=Sphingomonas crocodyli TaxID=1979270 RepID=A0A437LZ07_9SPHN|nr:DUF3768 domain-containing protein [Sphingomonas crocodyli]
MTDAVAQLLGDRSTPAGVDRLRRLFEAVRDFDRFTADNDPYGEHDFGRFELFGEALYWKIDYYDRACGGASPDATNPDVTCRILTIMRVRDY